MTKETPEETPKAPVDSVPVLPGPDLQRLLLAKYKVQLAVSEAKLADSTYKNVLQDIYLKFGLSINHVINEETGQVILPPPEATNAA